MTPQEIREGHILPLLRDKRMAIHEILAHTMGGDWEAWLQIEAARAFLACFKCSFSRLQSYYPNAGTKYDMKVQDLKGAGVYFELKAQTDEEDHTTALRMRHDIVKVRNLAFKFKSENLIIVIAVSKLTNAVELANFRKLMADYEDDVQAYDLLGEVLPANRLMIDTLTLFWFACAQYPTQKKC